MELQVLTATPFLFSAGDQTQDFVPANQALFQLSFLSSPGRIACIVPAQGNRIIVERNVIYISK